MDRRMTAAEYTALRTAAMLRASQLRRQAFNNAWDALARLLPGRTPRPRVAHGVEIG